MTTAHQFILEPYKGMRTRYNCPQCNKKEFTLYIDTTTGEHVAHDVGRCNRVDNCGHHYTPKAFFADNPELSKTDDWKKSDAYKKRLTPSVFVTEKPISLIEKHYLTGSLKGYEANNFVKFLINRFGNESTKKLIDRYFIGTSKHWNGATTFWQVDIEGKVRTGKIMLYNHETGKRVKEPFNHIHWVHSLLKLENFNLNQCLFGEHLLSKEPTKTVAIVESEKTAIIASLYLPQFIWLATGGKENMKAEKLAILKGRNVVLYPDLNAFDKWSMKAKDFSSIAKFTVSDLLERHASETEKQSGLDIADYLLRFDVKAFEDVPPTIEKVACDASDASDDEIKPFFSAHSEIDKDAYFSDWG
jgi:Domain of unknown function (DUF6371)